MSEITPIFVPNTVCPHLGHYVQLCSSTEEAHKGTAGSSRKQNVLGDVVKQDPE